MIESILNSISDFSFEVLIIAITVFILTNIIKQPIKKITNKLNESKRLATNSVIVLVPITLSTIVTILYYGISSNTWFSMTHVKTIINSSILSISIYAIYERIKLIIKNAINGNNDKELIQETEKDIKKLLSKIKNDQQKIKDIEKHISQLTKEIDLNEDVINLLTVFNNNIKIADLNNQKNNLKNEIKEIQIELEKKT